MQLVTFLKHIPSISLFPWEWEYINFYGSWNKLVAENLFLGMLCELKMNSSFLSKKSIAIYSIIHFKYKSSFTYSEEGTSFSVSVSCTHMHAHKGLNNHNLARQGLAKTAELFFHGVKKIMLLQARKEVFSYCCSLCWPDGS